MQITIYVQITLEDVQFESNEINWLTKYFSTSREQAAYVALLMEIYFEMTMKSVF